MTFSFESGEGSFVITERSLGELVCGGQQQDIFWRNMTYETYWT